jgi:hypothetical protein
MGPRYFISPENFRLVVESNDGDFSCKMETPAGADYLAAYLNIIHDQIEEAKAEGHRVAVETLMAIASAPPVMVETPLGPLPLLTTTVVDLATRLHEIETQRKMQLEFLAGALRPLSTSPTLDPEVGEPPF